MLRFATLFLVLFAISLPSPAHAIKSNKEKLNSAITDPEYSQNLMNVLSALMKRNRITCNNQPSMQRSKPTILQRVKFRDGSKMPYSGRWQEIIFLQGCGKRTQFNFMATADKEGGQPTIYPLVPGLTEVSPVHQREAIDRAVMHAQSANPKCQDMFVAYSQFYKWRNPQMYDTKLHPWFEKWYVDVCGEEKEVIIQFIPDEAFNIFRIQAELNPDYDPSQEEEEKEYQSDYDDY